MATKKDPKINYDKFGDDDWTKTFRTPTPSDISWSRTDPKEKPKKFKP